MAIILKCSQCQAQLEVDDAFANGICRCVHCGALSQVPSAPTRMDRKGRPLTPPTMAAPAVAAAKAEQVFIAPTREFTAEKRQGLMALILLALAAVMLVGVVIMLKIFFRPAQSPNQHREGEVGTLRTGGELTAKKNPNFVGLDIAGQRIAYLVNGGKRDLFDGMTAAVEVSVRTLGPRKFVAIIWPEGGGEVMGEVTASKAAEVFPADGLAAADTAADRAELRDWLEQRARGQTRDPLPAVEAALARGADTLLLITPTDLSDEQVKAIQAKSAGKNVTFLAAYVCDQGAKETAPGLAKLVPDAKGRAVITSSQLTDVPENMPVEPPAPPAAELTPSSEPASQPDL